VGLGYGLVSAGIFPGDPRSWTDVYREALELTELADRLGLDRVWTTEHHFVDDGYMPSLLVVSAAMAARTTQIKISTGVLLAPLHHPLRLAEDAATVDLISGGRLELGLGLGWSPIEFAALGSSLRTRGKAMDEILDILSQAWTGDPIDHHGSVYDLPSVGVRPAPARPIPVLIGGGADVAVRRAARAADGFFSNASPRSFRRQVEVAQAEFDMIGRDPAAFAWHYYTFVYPCDDADQGWEEIKDYLWATRAKYGDMGDSAGRAGPPPPPPPASTGDMEKMRKAIMLGTGEEIASQIAELRANIGVDFDFSARSYFPGMPFSQQQEVVERLAVEVMPLV
jgi:probable F420-dependent oxidoreductase